MAIYHFSMKPIARRSGRSAVASAAYRAAERLTNERDGLTHDFTNKQGVEHAEIVLPTIMRAKWATVRSDLWNAAERVERRKDARIAREFEVALPHELSSGQRLALTRAFAQDLADRYGAAVDVAIHRPHGESDTRNCHAHLMMTTRKVTERGLGEKTVIERENRWLLANHMPTSQLQLKDLRQAWEHFANRHLAMAGLDIRIDHRSHREAGLSIEPTEHVGVHATQINRQGREISRTRIDPTAANRNADLIKRQPEQILALITNEKSVFDRYDIARCLHRYINDDPQTFQNAFAAVMTSKALVELQPEKFGAKARTGEARYSTAEMINIEAAIARDVVAMKARDNHAVLRRHVEAALEDQHKMIKGNSSSEGQGLSGQQRYAIEHVTGANQIALVVGFAGAGKSTMLSAARQSWVAQGYRVHGATLSGKAAEGLEASSGIASRTLASWEYGWRSDRSRLTASDIFVIDEAGMVGSRQLARFVEEVRQAGAKLVLVGDHEQLQAIGAGAPFRAIAEAIGYAQLSEVRRQRANWQKQASIDFASHQTKAGLSAYEAHGHIRLKTNRCEALEAIIADYIMDRESNPGGTRIAMSHRRKDVHAINAGVRTALQERGVLAKGLDGSTDLGQEITYQTNDGKRAFARGDRVVFLQNDRDLNVKNGMLGEVVSVEPDVIKVRLDTKARSSDGQPAIAIPVKSYQAFDHGYATTIHKTQGSTVDRSFVLASTSMDRHLTYVAMTRHQDEVRLYAGLDEFKSIQSMRQILSRSGAKETTLDYTRGFASRRGLDLHRADLGLELSAGATVNKGSVTQPDPVAELKEHVQANPTLEAPSNSPLFTQHNKDPRPILIPAVAKYEASVEVVARTRALQAIESDWEFVKSLASRVFLNPDAVTDSLRSHIVDSTADPAKLSTQLRASPERMGALVGSVGIFGRNSERRQALYLAGSLASHVDRCANNWQRRLAAEQQSEIWKREREDIVEIRGFSKRSEAILEHLSRLPFAERSAFVDQLTTMPEGRQALDEAKDITRAVEKRFGPANSSNLPEQLKRVYGEHAGQLDRIREVVRLANRSYLAELTQQLELKRSLTRGLGLKM